MPHSAESSVALATSTQRREITIRGIVQSVGFRPFVFRLAHRHQLTGSVRNVSGAVKIEIEGSAQALDDFSAAVVDKAPPLAKIDQVTSVVVACRGESDGDFRIVDSTTEQAEIQACGIFVSPDVAPCADCLRELFDPADRRFRYPFLNCTNCGPRLTIVHGAPYDRRLTSMAPFALCAECLAEYQDPLNRRYHAEPTCCPNCGPQLQLLTSHGEAVATNDPLRGFAECLNSAKIGALKGVGGYHLVCDAGNQDAVAALRQRKGRDDKPFAVMVADVEQAEQWCHVGDLERELLSSRARPIVLLQRRRTAGGEIADGVAPGNPYLGVMLPSTPLHYLLAEAAEWRPLVMTSGNRSNEPIAYEDDVALDRLSRIADVFLIHNRAIHVRCDDSVTRVLDRNEAPLRRSRGYAPRPLPLPEACPCSLLAVGGQLKSTFALGHEQTAIVSHHLGDLDDYQAYRAFERDIALYESLHNLRPQRVVHDLHPDYASTDYARRRAAAEGIETLAVQHHHAHVAACLAEHALRGEVIGVAFDGAGLGTDGAIWGGEFLVAEYADFRRVAHLRYVPLPGGDQAARHPWRAAVAQAIDAGCDPKRLPLVPSPAELRTTERMIERGIHCPLTSSMGRLFDAVAAMTGLRASATFEGQAAMELEWQATGFDADGSYPFELTRVASAPDSPLEIDTRPLVRAVLSDAGRGIDRRLIARRFHTTIAEMIVAVCGRIHREAGLDRTVLSGGVFLNALLLQEATARLTDEGFQVFRHRLVPTNDGGISFGQLAVAAARLRSTTSGRDR